MYNIIISHVSERWACFLTASLPSVHRCYYAVGIIFTGWLLGAFHVVDEGHIGVYKRGGALLNTWTEPGLHYMLPFLTTVSE
jgi:hypothetical protein